MRKWIAFCAVTLLIAVPAAPAAAQTFGFGARAGVSLPMGDYGGNEELDDGFAELGFSAGLDLWYPLSAAAAGLSWYTSAEVAAHSFDDEGSEDAVDGGYLLFPILTGLRFDIPVGATSLFVTGQGGLIVTRPPGDQGEFGTDFGFAFGGGAQINENIYAGLKYYPLGDVNFSIDDGTEAERSVSYLDIFIGFGVH